MFRTRCWCILCAVLGLAVAWLLTGAPAAHAQSKDAPKGPVSFINDVAPLLKENCYACHDSKKKKGKFELTSYDTLRKGGTKDDPIVPGKSKESLLIDVVTMTGPGRMPPKEAGDLLPKEKVAIIAKWIDEGAKLDAGIEPKAEMLRELRIRWKPPIPPVAYKFPVNVNSMVFTPDNKKLVVGGYHELTQWDAATGKLERRIFTRAERAYGMVFLPDGKLVVAGGRPGQEGDVRIYNLQAGAPKDHGAVPSVDGVNDKSVMVQELVQTDDAILGLTLSADGKKLAAAGCDRLVRVWEVPSFKADPPIENHADWVFGLAFSPDGKSLATASRDKTAKLWDLAAKESLLTFPDHQNPVYAVAMTPDGKLGISGGEDGQIRFWQATDASKNIGKQTKNMQHGKAVFRLAMGGDSKKPVLASCSADGTIKTWDPIAVAPLKTMAGLTDWAYAVAVSPDGNLVAGGAWNGEVRVWKTADAVQVTVLNASPGYVAPKLAAKEEPKKK